MCENSLEIWFRKNISETPLCELTIDGKDLDAFRRAIAENYVVWNNSILLSLFTALVLFNYGWNIFTCYSFGRHRFTTFRTKSWKEIEQIGTLLYLHSRRIFLLLLLNFIVTLFFSVTF